MQNFISLQNFEGILQNLDPGPLSSLNKLNQKGPLTPAGSSPYCVLLEVVCEDIVKSIH